MSDPKTIVCKECGIETPAEKQMPTHCDACKSPFHQPEKVETIPDVEEKTAEPVKPCSPQVNLPSLATKLSSLLGVSTDWLLEQAQIAARRFEIPQPVSRKRCERFNK